jgi:anti-anti-sigma factor
MSVRLTPTPAAGRFSANASRAADTAFVAFRGELDIAALPCVDATIDALLDSGVRDLLVDLERVTYLDAAGVGALVRAAHVAHARGAREYVFRARGRPREVLDWARARCPVAGL